MSANTGTHDVTAEPEAATTARVVIGRLIEAAWLVALAGVPVLFSPPGWFAFFETPRIALLRLAAGLIVTLWSVDVLLAAWRAGVPSVEATYQGTKAWLREEPIRWVLPAVGVYLVWVGLSTWASAVPRIAFWGFEYGRDGQSLYGIASVVVVFFAVSLRLRTMAQAWRAVAAIVLSGVAVTVYSLLQSQGADPYDLSRILPGRVIGPLRNPIFLASFLLQVLPLAIIVALLAWRRTGRWYSGAAATLMPAAILLVIAMTLARGPWVGTAVAIVALAGAGLIVLGKVDRIRGGVVVLASLVLAGVALAVIPTPSGDDSVGAAVDRLGSFSGEVQGNVSKRTIIWETSLELVQGRPWFSFEDGAPSWMRHLFGYGPDTFVYAYSLEAEPTSTPSIRLVKDGHNLWVHNAVEIGLIGALLLLAVYALPVLIGAHSVVYRWRDWEMPRRLLAAGVVAVIAGRGIEQLSGVTQTSDALLFWALLGLLVALPSVGSEGHAPGRAASSAVTKSAVIVVAVAVAAGSLALTWTHTANNLMGARDAALSVKASQEENNVVKAIELVNSAIDHSPAVAAYRIRAAGLFDTIRLRTPEIDEDALIEGELDILHEGLKHNRLSFLLNSSLGETLQDSVRRGRSDRTEAAADAFEKGAALFPNVRDPHYTAGLRLLELGLPERAMPFIDRAVALSADDAQRAGALFLKGVGLRDAGVEDRAIDVLREVQALAPDTGIAATAQALIDAILQEGSP